MSAAEPGFPAGQSAATIRRATFTVLLLPFRAASVLMLGRSGFSGTSGRKLSTDSRTVATPVGSLSVPASSSAILVPQFLAPRTFPGCDEHFRVQSGLVPCRQQCPRDLVATLRRGPAREDEGDESHGRVHVEHGGDRLGDLPTGTAAEGQVHLGGSGRPYGVCRKQGATDAVFPAAFWCPACLIPRSRDPESPRDPGGTRSVPDRSCSRGP